MYPVKVFSLFKNNLEIILYIIFCVENYFVIKLFKSIAGQSSLVARKAHNLEVAGSNPAPANCVN